LLILISVIIVLSCFIGVIILILSNKVNRAVASLAGAIITFFALFFFEGYEFSSMIEFMFGTESDSFVNLHSLILIIGMMIIVQIASDAGLFQFIAIKLIQFSKGKSMRLLVIFCFLTVFITSVLNNILAVIILIPLTVTISRILNIDPTPYILVEALLVNIGGSLFIISSIPNILVANYANITFIDFFLNVGGISLIIFGFTLLFFILLYKNTLVIPKEGLIVLKEFDVWNLVQNKRLLYESAISLTILMISFVAVPPSLIAPDMIALSIAIILIIISRLEPKEIINKINYELLFYLLGIFIITGALESLKVLELMGNSLSGIGGNTPFIQIIFILWFSAFLSSSIDNLPITQVLIPVVNTMMISYSLPIKNAAFYTLAIGANWGDNLTPLGDNILVMNIAEQNKRPINVKKFFKLGFITTIYQLLIVSIIFTIIFYLNIGLLLLGTLTLCITIFYLSYKFGPKKYNQKIKSILQNVKNKIIG
jgi:Na+/H+ antiporter NhaD/arsenite permease-like protein